MAGYFWFIVSKKCLEQYVVTCCRLVVVQAQVDWHVEMPSVVLLTQKHFMVWRFQIPVQCLSIVEYLLVRDISVVLQIVAASCERWPCVPSLYDTWSCTHLMKLSTCRICDAAGISRAFITLRPWPRVLQLSEIVEMFCQRLAATVLLRPVEGYVRRRHLFHFFFLQNPCFWFLQQMQNIWRRYAWCWPF